MTPPAQPTNMASPAHSSPYSKSHSPALANSTGTQPLQLPSCPSSPLSLGSSPLSLSTSDAATRDAPLAMPHSPSSPFHPGVAKQPAQQRILPVSTYVKLLPSLSRGASLSSSTSAGSPPRGSSPSHPLRALHSDESPNKRHQTSSAAAIAALAHAHAQPPQVAATSAPQSTQLLALAADQPDAFAADPEMADAAATRPRHTSMPTPPTGSATRMDC